MIQILYDRWIPFGQKLIILRKSHLIDAIQWEERLVKIDTSVLVIVRNFDLKGGWIVWLVETCLTTPERILLSSTHTFYVRFFNVLLINVHPLTIVVAKENAVVPFRCITNHTFTHTHGLSRISGTTAHNTTVWGNKDAWTLCFERYAICELT